jgi:hypothetical protein
MKDQFIVGGYQITTDPLFQNKRFGITPELSAQLESLFHESQNKKNKKIIDKLTDLILKHPTVPILKNYLSIAYNTRGNHAKAVEVNKWLLSEHPDYLFGKLNEANICIENNEPEKVPSILGESLEIKSLYPDREVFHLAEVTGYFKTVIRYLAYIEHLELAENRFKLLQEIAPEHHDTEQAEKFLRLLRLKASTKRWEEENKNRIIPVIIKTTPKTKKKSAPEFNHPEIQYLYEHGFRIPHEKLSEILALPRKTLVQDLENVLTDAVDRFSYFTDAEYDEETCTFVLHALFLLKELNAEESLPKILSFLEYDYKFLDYWLGDHKNETLWQVFYVMGISNTQILKEFLLKPGIDTFSKTVISQAFTQIILHHPERKSEFLPIYNEILTCFLNAAPKDNIIDTDLIALLIGDCLDCKLNELLPLIKSLYDKNIVNLSINGDYNEVVRFFKEIKSFSKKDKILNIFELYDDVVTTWSGYQNNEEDYNNDYMEKIPQPAVSEKIGRNEPCPCGSGKKYKKCCWGK